MGFTSEPQRSVPVPAHSDTTAAMSADGSAATKILQLKSVVLWLFAYMCRINTLIVLKILMHWQKTTEITTASFGKSIYVGLTEHRTPGLSPGS